MSMLVFRAIAKGALTIAVGMLAGAALAQPPFGSPPQPRPDATLAAAPEGFDVPREGAHAGRVERIEEDGLFNISAGVHEYLAAQNVPHRWYVDAGAHTFPVWKNDLYHFASLLFRT